MAKNMARIENGIVVNMEWHPDTQPQTDVLIDPGDRAVGIGDTYDGTDFYRDGERIPTRLEAALAELEDAKNALALLGYEEAANG